MTEEKKEATPKAPVEKKVTKDEQKRLDAQQATINQQKASARNDAVNLLDNLAAQVALDRKGHFQVQNAIAMIRGSNAELAAYESGAKTAKKGTEEEG